MTTDERGIYTRNQILRKQCFGSALFLQIRIRGVKGENDFFYFFHVSDDLNKIQKIISAPNCLKGMINAQKHMLPVSPNVKPESRIFFFFLVSKAFLTNPDS